MSPNCRIVLNTLATYGRSLLALVCGLFTGRWALMSLGEVNFGLYGVVGCLTVFISFINTSLSASVERFYAYSIGEGKGNSIIAVEEGRKWFNAALLAHSILPSILIFIGYPLGVYAVRHWLVIPIDRIEHCVWVFRFACCSCFIGMINVPFSAMYTAKQYISELTVYSILQTVANFLVLFYMVTHPGDWLTKYAFIMMLIAAIPQVLICIRAIVIFQECRLRIKYLFRLDYVRRLGAFAFWNLYGIIGWTLRSQGMSIVVNRFYGPIFNASNQVSNTVISHVSSLSGALIGAFTPAITTALGAGETGRMRELAFRACKFGVILVLVFLIPLALELPEVVALWLSAPPPSVVEVCWLLMLVLVVEKSTIGHSVALLANGKIAHYLFFSGGALILTVPTAVLLVLMGGEFVLVVGGAILLTTVLCSLGRLFFARRLVGMSIRRWLREVLCPSLFTILLTGLAGYLIQLFMPQCLARVGVTVLACEIVFVPVTWYVFLNVGERRFLMSGIRAKFLRRDR